ncbi:MAG: leucyl aminopeptidase [Desulfobacterales bacterium]|jgi:leucyl aminopeptidase
MITFTSKKVEQIKTGMLVVTVCSDTDIHDSAGIAALIATAADLNEFKGDRDDELILYHPVEFEATRVMLIGLGESADVDRESFRIASGRAVNQCIAKKINEVTFAVPSYKKFKIGMAGILEGLVEGAVLGNHRFTDYKAEKKHHMLKKIRFRMTSDATKKMSPLARRIETICRGTLLARNWVNTPANDKKPAQFARTIIGLAKKEHLKTMALGPKELRQKGFGAMLAVAAGSRNAPRLVVLEHPSKGSKKTVVLVGKGVTFDSGGLNLKPSSSLHRMKADMAGAAAVAATLINVARLSPELRIIGIIPLVENMVSGTATRPGDIITNFAGKTVEIGNTDAEGRLILIDAISYAVKKYKPQMLIDIATLTGACVTALGEKIAGLFTLDDVLAEIITEAGAKTHERCWRMPLPDDYKELLKSDWADINNMPSTRAGGAISAALFIAAFVGSTRWAHIDIAGPAYSKKESPYCSAGATGFGVRLLCQTLDRMSQPKEKQ